MLNFSKLKSQSLHNYGNQNPNNNQHIIDFKNKKSQQEFLDFQYLQHKQDIQNTPRIYRQNFISNEQISKTFRRYLQNTPRIYRQNFISNEQISKTFRRYFPHQNYNHTLDTFNINNFYEKQLQWNPNNQQQCDKFIADGKQKKMNELAKYDDPKNPIAKIFAKYQIGMDKLQRYDLKTSGDKTLENFIQDACAAIKEATIKINRKKNGHIVLRYTQYFVFALALLLFTISAAFNIPQLFIATFICVAIGITLCIVNNVFYDGAKNEIYNLQQNILVLNNETIKLQQISSTLQIQITEIKGFQQKNPIITSDVSQFLTTLKASVADNNSQKDFCQTLFKNQDQKNMLLIQKFQDALSSCSENPYKELLTMFNFVAIIINMQIVGEMGKNGQTNYEQAHHDYQNRFNAIVQSFPQALKQQYQNIQQHLLFKNPQIVIKDIIDTNIEEPRNNKIQKLNKKFKKTKQAQQKQQQNHQHNHNHQHTGNCCGNDNQKHPLLQAQYQPQPRLLNNNFEEFNQSSQNQSLLNSNSNLSYNNKVPNSAKHLNKCLPKIKRKPPNTKNTNNLNK